VAAVKKEKSRSERDFKVSFEPKTKIPNKKIIKTATRQKKDFLKGPLNLLGAFSKQELILFRTTGKISKRDWRI